MRKPFYSDALIDLAAALDCYYADDVLFLVHREEDAPSTDAGFPQAALIR